ncbi:Hypothetical protein ING2D1G_1247 [Peptoniphilus sp. ING2-D1G]|nr:Hypothetical protein ING2D1G_1247 [Peptoniphilus sp. ING2-D1G]
MNTIYKFNGTICSDLAKLKDFLNITLCDLRKYILDEEVMFDLRLILDELIINGMVHGNSCDKCKNVNLTINLKPHSILIKVEDEGDGIEYDFDEYDYRSRKSCGRGLVIVQALSDSLIFNKNEVTVLKKL